MMLRIADTTSFSAIDKQKMLLSSDVGHFSLIRALHLADTITLMNGAFSSLPGSELTWIQRAN
jgi:hypothetical protein